MLNKKELHFLKISQGYEKAYLDFLQSKLNFQMAGNYHELFNYLLDAVDLTKCDYYAVYDISQYLIDIKHYQRVEKKPLALKLYTKLHPAAVKGNIAAQCAIIILNDYFELTNEKDPNLEDFHHKALKTVAKTTKKNKNHEKVIWSNLFLAIYSHLITKEKNRETTFKYLQPLFALNAAAVHYNAFYFNNNPNMLTKNLPSMYYYYQDKLNHLACLDYHFSAVYIHLLLNKKIKYDSETLRKINEILLSIKDYNPGRAYYLLGNSEYYAGNKHRALQYYKDAQNEGAIEASKQIEMLTAALKNEKTASEKLAVHLDDETTEFLSKKKDGTYVVKIHKNLKKSKTDKTIDQTLYSTILNEIATNSNISTLLIENEEYNFDLDLFIQALEKNKTIHSFTIYNSWFHLKDFLKICHFLQRQEQIKHLSLKLLKILFPQNVNNSTKLYYNSLINLISSIKNLESLEIDVCFSEENLVKNILVAIKNNTHLFNTKIKIGDLQLNNENLLLLADLLNNNVSYLDFQSSEHKFDAKTITAFGVKLERNTSLKHLGLNMFIENANVSEDIILASYQLFNSLIENTEIKSLDLSETLYNATLNPNLITTLCTKLKNNKFLTSLNLSRNLLGDDAITQIAYVFKYNSPIEKLNLSANSFTDKSLSVLADVLKNYPNNLRDLDLSDNTEEEANTINIYKFYKNLSKILSNPSCVLEKLSLPIFVISSKPSSSLGFDHLLSALASNQTIRSLEFSGYITNEILSSLVKLAHANKNIIRINYPSYDLSCQLEEELNTILDNNRKASENEHSLKSEAIREQESIQHKINKKSEEIVRPKCSLKTFQTIFDYTKLSYQISVKDDTTLVINFEDEYLANAAFATLKSVSTNFILDKKQLIIPNYNLINEQDVFSVIFVLKSNMNKPIAFPALSHTNLINYLNAIKGIHASEHGNILIIRLKDASKFNKESKNLILEKISNALKQRNFPNTINAVGINLADYQEINQDKYTGLSGEIKNIIKAELNLLKFNNQKESYLAIQKKLDDKKFKKLVKSEKPEIKSENFKKLEMKPIENTIPDTEKNSKNLQDMKSEESLEVTNQVVVCVTNKEINLPLPTEVKFRKLLQTILDINNNNNEYKLDPIMHLILTHHHTALDIQTKTDNPWKAAYALLYHSVRISELTNLYIQLHHKDNTSLASTAHGMRTILADQPDYFLPNNLNLTVDYLQQHPLSFLTISRQILLELFDKQQVIKNKLQTGYSTVVFYKDFYNDLANLKIKLMPQDKLISNVTNVLIDMLNIMQFIKDNLLDLDFEKISSDLSLSDINICALKAAIFLLGHYSRILRDHHSDFCKNIFHTSIVKNNFSKKLEKSLLQFLDATLVHCPLFDLLEQISKLDKTQIIVIAKNSSFIDSCLLFIQSRNVMSHTDENDELSDKLNGFNEIPLATIARLYQYFFKTDRFYSQLKNVLMQASQLNSKTESQIQETKSSVTLINSLLNANSPVFTPLSQGNEEALIITNEEINTSKSVI